jgi:hypothetical protein
MGLSALLRGKGQGAIRALEVDQSMKKCALLANCQQGPIRQLLESVDEFNRQYTIVDQAHLHMWNGQNIDNFANAYKTTDIILTQPIYDDKYGLAKTENLLEVNSKTRNIPIIIFPNVEFIGFSPFIIKVPVRHDKFFVPDAQCGIVFWCYINGYSASKAFEFCSNFFNDNSRVEIYRFIYDFAVKRLESAEQRFRMNINVSHLFRTKFKDAKLMINRWHPSNLVYAFLVNGLLSSLEIFEKARVPRQEFMAFDEVPISNSIKRALGICFEDDYFYVMGFLKTLAEYINILYAFYMENPALVDIITAMNHARLKTINSIINCEYQDLDYGPLFHW